jgi:hypothetical protein
MSTSVLKETSVLEPRSVFQDMFEMRDFDGPQLAKVLATLNPAKLP